LTLDLPGSTIGWSLSRVFDPSRVAAILFDIDGTLADSDDRMVDAIAHRLSRLRVRSPRRAARRLVMMFETPVNWAITALDRAGLGRLLPQRVRQGHADAAVAGPVEGVPGMLRRMADRYPLAVVTTRSRPEAEHFLMRSRLSSYFTAIIARGSSARLKPDPGPILHAARELNVPAERCLMVGDTTPDVLAARRAGAIAVAVLCGYGERRELERAGAHAIIEHTALLPQLLQPAPAAGSQTVASSGDDMGGPERVRDDV
jgi:phosphoglycolate phosphatase-like HAD superfamily hydrolase